MRLLEKLLASRWLVNIIGLKAIYQLAYIIFNLIVVKKLSIAEYGSYAYVVAIIVYFSTIPMLGLPIYLQKNVAKEKSLNYRYFVVSFVLAIFSLIIAFSILPSITLFQKIAIVIIILSNCLLAIPVPINDGMGKYSFQYKFLFISSIWMIICIVQALLLKKNITFNLILNYWLLNSFVTISLLSIIIFRLLRSAIKLIYDLKLPYSLILIDLVLLYAVSIPDGFARFYDRYLAHKFITDTFLGNYSFNLMIITTIYALFIRPINSVLFTQLSKSTNSLVDCAQIIKKYYLFGLSIYFLFFCMYFPFSNYILLLLGLTKYKGTLNIFCVCFVTAILYFLTIPFTNLIALGERGRKKVIYCITSLMIFNTPLIFLFIQPKQEYFYMGFILAYFLNFIFCISFEHKIAVYCYQLITKGVKNSIKIQYAKLQSLI